MAKYVILNFDETDRFRLTTERPELSLASSTFNPAKPGVFFLPDDSEAVFIQLIGLNPVKDLGHDAGPALSRFAEAGGRVVCFIGPSDQAELGKLIGPLPELHFQPNSLPESIFFNPEEPYQSVFEQFQMSISHAYKLLPAALAEDSWKASPKLSRAATVLAKSSDGYPVALLLPHGRGSYVLLPWFGTNNIDVVSTLLSPPRKKAAPEPETPPPVAEISKSIPGPEIPPPANREPAVFKAPKEPLPGLEAVIAGLSNSVPEPEILPSANDMPAADENAASARIAALVDVMPVIPDSPPPAPEPVIPPPEVSAPRREEVPRVVGEPSLADIGTISAEISRPVPEPQMPAPAPGEPVPVESPAAAPAPAPAEAAPPIPAVAPPAHEPDIVPPQKPGPLHEEPLPIAALPALADVGDLVAGILKPVPKPEIPPPTNHEPAPPESPATVQVPPPAEAAPVIPAAPAPAPGPEIVPPPQPEAVQDRIPPVAAVPPAGSGPDIVETPGPVPEPEPLPAMNLEPAPDIAPDLAQPPDKVPVPSIPDLVAGGEETAWLEQEEYALPELREINARRDAETLRHAQARQEIDERHAQAMQEIDERLQAFKASGQEAFLNLLRAEGRELVQAVIFVLKDLGWTRVIDVHDYWKKVIRAKEEEIWVLESDSPSVEVGLMRDKLLLVLVRSGPAGATDDECALLQRFKGRRMQEYHNTQMKALLIGNYFLATEPKSRPSPFSPQQAEDAQKDGNALLATYDLFRAVKAEKEGRVAKEDLRRELREQSGLIRFAF